MSSMLTVNSWDVIIIGAGPAGLAAATTLKKKGVEKVLVLEREMQPGGIPRHCGHPPFGILEYKSLMTGLKYSARLSRSANQSGVEILCGASVLKLSKGGYLTIATTDGITQLNGRRVLIATGTRETPRAARLVSGKRVAGIYTTGALQSLIYLKKIVPFKAPVIVGSETVSFSALMTCKKAGISPKAMLAEKSPASISPLLCYGANLLGVPFLFDTNISSIQGKGQVESVIAANSNGNKKEVACDSVIFTGNFTPESSLARASLLKVNTTTGSPEADQYNRCSDPFYYVAGNILPPVNMAAKCWLDGKKTAEYILQDLKGKGRLPWRSGAS